MAENLMKRPQKGILKTSSSFEQQEAQRRAQDIKWDEMNILQTLHPADKDYGHMKIEEPKTPYNYYKDELDGDVPTESKPLDLNLLAKKIEMGSDVLPKAMMEEESDSDDDEFANETEEERAKRKLFEQKRKSHYNEFYAVKLARKLMQNDDDDDEEDEDEDEENNGNQEVKTENLSSETNEMAQDDSIIESKM